MRLLVVACLVVGCDFHHGSLSPGDGAVDDGARDARPIDGMVDACVSFSTHTDTCMPPIQPGGPLALAGENTYDTDTETLTTPNGTMPVPAFLASSPDGDIVVIVVNGFALAGTLRVTGTNMRRPFGIVSYGPVGIDGLIDLSKSGAGARTDTACQSAGLRGTNGENDTGGGGGGGGAAMAGDGGDGEDGDKDGNSDGGPSNGGNGGTKLAARPTRIIGGCSGNNGGNAGGNGGLGGNGGGAIFIASSISITIGANGGIDVGGAGGRGGRGNGGGGGGGGSAGMIVLEAASVAINGVLAANGGGGGEGADGSDGDDGSDGGLTNTRASGGSGDADVGGDGGDGGAGATLNGADANDYRNGGGGGGGGGAGFIAIGPATPVLNNATISPQFGVWP